MFGYAFQLSDCFAVVGVDIGSEKHNYHVKSKAYVNCSFKPLQFLVIFVLLIVIVKGQLQRQVNCIIHRQNYYEKVPVKLVHILERYDVETLSSCIGHCSVFLLLLELKLTPIKGGL